MSDTNLPTAAPNPELGYDRHEARPGILAILFGLTLIVLLGIIFGVYGFYVIAEDKVLQDQVQTPTSDELKVIHAREEEQLNHYGFIDKEKGLVRLPIDRSIEVLAQEAKDGKVTYNIKTYPVKVEAPGGAAGGAAAAAADGSVPAAPGSAAPATPAPAAAAPGAHAK